MLSETEQGSDTRDFWRFVRTNFNKLIIFSFAGGLLALAGSFLIPRQYQSYAVVYPPSSTAIESSIDYPNFGYDVEADRLIQILESREIRDSVIKKFRLEEYFEVDYKNPAWHDALIKQYGKNIKLERTTSMAVVITAKTKDPELSANIVNHIIYCADRFREKIYKKNIIPAFEHADEEYRIQKIRVDTAEAKLIRLLKENDLSSLLILMSDAQISINLDKINALSPTASSSVVGAEIISFKSIYRTYEEARGRMLKVKKTLDNPIPSLFVIHAAEPMYKKVSPSYTMNALAGAVITLLVTVTVLLVSRSRERSLS